MALPRTLETRVIDPAPTAVAVGPSSTHRFARYVGAPSAQQGGFPHDFTWGRISAASPSGLADVAWWRGRPRAGGFPFVEGTESRQAPPPADPLVATVKWAIGYNASTNITPALYTASATTGSNNLDRLYVYGSDTTNGTYLEALNNLYSTATCGATTASPCGLWLLPIDSAIKGSNIGLDISGKVVYAVSGGNGTTVPARLWRIQDGASQGTSVNCGGNATTMQWSSPWPDYLRNQIWVGDEQGRLMQADGTTLSASCWTITGETSAVHSTPVVWNSTIWWGNDQGDFLYSDVSGGGLSTVRGWSLCRNSPCSAQDAIWSTPWIDTTNDRLIIAANNVIWQIDSISTCAPAGTCMITNFGITLGISSNTAIFKSSLAVDQTTNNYVYAGINNRLFRCSYKTGTGSANGLQSCPTSSNTVDRAVLTGSNADLSYPNASPIQWGGDSNLYIGDGGGFVNRVGNNGSGSLGSLASFQYSAGGVTATTLDSSPISDFLSASTGSLYYGAKTGSASTPGIYVSLNQGF